MDFSFTHTALTPAGKSGKIYPDKKGYFTVVGGALNVHNSRGDFYPAQGAMEIFENSSVFMSTVNQGALYSENGHPNIDGIPTEQKQTERLLNIDQDKMTNHIGSVWLDDELAHKHPDVLPSGAIAVLLRVKPYGPLRHMCADAMKNDAQNICYSSRTFTQRTLIDGVLHKVIKYLVTFDLVTLPGISAAKKRYSPSMESFGEFDGDRMVADIVAMREKVESDKYAYSSESGSSIVSAHKALVDGRGRPLSWKWK